MTFDSERCPFSWLHPTFRKMRRYWPTNDCSRAHRCRHCSDTSNKEHNTFEWNKEKKNKSRYRLLKMPLHWHFIQIFKHMFCSFSGFSFSFIVIGLHMRMHTNSELTLLPLVGYYYYIYYYYFSVAGFWCVCACENRTIEERWDADAYTHTLIFFMALIAT